MEIFLIINWFSRHSSFALLLIVFVSLGVGGCVTYQDNTAANPYAEVQQKLVESAHWAKGRTDVSCRGRRFAMDCSGVVSAIYWQAGIDLQSCYPRYTGNGVARIYRWMEDEQLLYRPDRPVPGDVLFWDNSYDKNGNGRADDILTHIGMVVHVDDEGLVTYVHYDYLSGIIFARMFPPDPSDRSRNSGMRIKSLGPAPGGKMTAGDLYRSAGQGWKLPRQ